MADAPTTSPQPAAPPPAGPSRSEAFLNAAKGFGKKLVAFLSTTTVALLGFAVILLTWGAVLADKHFAHLSAVAGPIADHVASWPFLFTGIGLLLVAKSRAMVRDNYAAEAKKTKGEYPHAWKIPLIGTQSLALNLLAFYALGVGIRLWPRLHNVILLLLLFLAFLTYLFWYVTAHFVNRFPKAAGLRIAVMALVLALLAAFAMSQVLLIGLILALFALLAALVSISVSPFSSPEGRVWIRALCLFGAIGLLVPTAYHYFFGGESQVKLIELNPAVKGLTGEVGALAYSPDGQRLAFSVKKDRWYLEMYTPGDHKNPMVKMTAGEDAFTPVFIDGGRDILADAVRDGERNLWLIHPDTGAQSQLTQGGALPTADGSPWSPVLGRFLFVTDGGHTLASLSPASRRVTALLHVDAGLSSPSYTYDGKQIVYLSGSGTDSAIHVYTPATRHDRKLLLAGKNHEDPVIPATLKPQTFTLLKVVPAPDAFRYLYVLQDGKRTSLWTVHPDGSKEAKLYETRGTLGKVAWLPDAQRVLFEETPRGLAVGGRQTTIKVLNANLSTVENLILSQVPDWDPAPTPNGANVAFVCNENLWYPSLNRLGIWVGALR